MSSTREALHEALAANIEAASIEVTGGDGGHFCIAITAPVFEGKSTLERHRLVLNSIKGKSGPDVDRIDIQENPE